MRGYNLCVNTLVPDTVRKNKQRRGGNSSQNRAGGSGAIDEVDNAKTSPKEKIAAGIEVLRPSKRKISEICQKS